MAKLTSVALPAFPARAPGQGWGQGVPDSSQDHTARLGPSSSECPATPQLMCLSFPVKQCGD